MNEISPILHADLFDQGLDVPDPVFVTRLISCPCVTWREVEGHTHAGPALLEKQAAAQDSYVCRQRARSIPFRGNRVRDVCALIAKFLVPIKGQGKLAHSGPGRILCGDLFGHVG